MVASDARPPKSSSIAAAPIAMAAVTTLNRLVYRMGHHPRGDYTSGVGDGAEGFELLGGGAGVDRLAGEV